MYHHMATQIALAACPGAEVWGCDSVEGRHPVPLGVKNPLTDGLSLAGVTFYHLPGTNDDEWWMYFAPSRFVGLGDLLPHIEEGVLQSSTSISLIRCAHCGDACTMMSYTRGAVIDHAGTAAVVNEILALDIDRMEGNHAPRTRADPHETLAQFWLWLVPRSTGLTENLA